MPRFNNEEFPLVAAVTPAATFLPAGTKPGVKALSGSASSVKIRRCAFPGCTEKIDTSRQRCSAHASVRQKTSQIFSNLKSGMYRSMPEAEWLLKKFDKPSDFSDALERIRIAPKGIDDIPEVAKALGFSSSVKSTVESFRNLRGTLVQHAGELDNEFLWEELTYPQLRRIRSALSEVTEQKRKECEKELKRQLRIAEIETELFELRGY